MELQTRNRLIEDHLDLVERLAKDNKRSLPHRISLDELVSAGYMGLVEAANKYEDQKGEFDTYVSSRIRGEMIGYLRELRRWGYAMPEPSASLSHDTEEADDALMYYETVSPDDFFDKVTRTLPPLGKKIIRWHFIEDMTGKEISKLLGYDEAHVSRLLAKYTERIREEFSEFELRQELEEIHCRR